MKIGVTMGDPSGIGPEITIKAIGALKGRDKLVIIGDYAVLNKCGLSKVLRNSFELVDLKNVSQKSFSFGKVRAEYGKASLEYINAGLKLIRARQIDCLVTNPISKESVKLSGERNFTGHTGYLAQKTHTKRVAMMLINDCLKFGLVTEHISLRRVPNALSVKLVYEKISLVNDYFERYFGIANPRIAVCALNPHASDHGLMGSEESRILSVAVNRLKKTVKSVAGPIAADIAISQLRDAKFDCCIAMYHDQALIPLKLTGYESGVNLTMGLPFIRTSPLHGVAFDIAGKHKANPASLITAIKFAKKCLLNQRKA